MTEQELRTSITPCIMAGNTWFVFDEIKAYAEAMAAESLSQRNPYTTKVRELRSQVKGKESKIERLKAELEAEKIKHQGTKDALERARQSNRVVEEVPEPNGEFVDRLIPLEDLRAFMVPHMKDKLPPYEDEADEYFKRGYRQCLYHLMEMLQINTCASKKERDFHNEMYSSKVW